MNDRILAPAAAALAVALCFGSYREVESRLASLPWPPVRGDRFDRVVEVSEESTPAPVEGSGTAADPYRLPFSRLALPEYDPPELRDDPSPLTVADLPAELQPFHGRAARVVGFVIAADVRDGAVRSAVLSRYPPGCCFGALPVFDEWIAVEVAEADAGSFPRDGQVAVTGVLEIGERIGESGSVDCLYRLRDAAGESLW